MSKTMNDCSTCISLCFQGRQLYFHVKNQACLNRFCMRVLALTYFGGLELILFLFQTLWVFQSYHTKIPQKVLLGYMCIFDDVQNEFVCKTNQIPRERFSCRYALEDLNQSLLSSLTLHSFLPHKFLGLMRVSSTCSKVCLSLL